MQLGDTANAQALPYGKPLDGVRILALEQMQALPYATQLLGRLGAEVVKIEPPGVGDQGRSSTPAMTDPAGRKVGATFLRSNLGKSSVCIDLRRPEGRELVIRLARGFDVVAENFKPGSMARLGLSYEDFREDRPSCIYLSVSGFGNTEGTSYRSWPAFSSVVEAMSGIYEVKRHGDQPPLVAPVGALGDIGAALYAVIGVLAALRHRDRTGEGQYLDIAMFDAVVAMTDVVTNFWSMGLRNGELGPLIADGFRARDGWFVLQVGREHQFAKLARLVGHPEWLEDERLATRQGWVDNLNGVLRPGIEGWAAALTKVEVCERLGAAGIAAGPCFSDAEVVEDPHLDARNMLVEMPRTDGVSQPVIIPGNPVKMTKVAEGPESRVPWLGEHTFEVLGSELGLSGAELADLKDAGVIA